MKSRLQSSWLQVDRKKGHMITRKWPTHSKQICYYYFTEY